MFGVLGVTTGCHRLWAHRTYSAVWPLRLLLITLHTLVCQVWYLDENIVFYMFYKQSASTVIANM